ncbi:MAG: hypothetical protein JSU72_15580 [Deltaproteobacteria bacterium]|nr:MAG: hypothetical protein JSU72_15580 [Deltaproteobacteria bacterium]
MAKSICCPILRLVILLALALAVPLATFASMESGTYRISTAVISGGGGAMSSQSYDMNSTLGQASAVGVSSSSTYANAAGFWQSSQAPSPGDCPCDVDGDGDVTALDALGCFEKSLSICPTHCGPCEQLCCDVTGDGECTAEDALEVFKASLKMYPNACSPE